MKRCPVEIVISEYCNEAIDIPIKSLNQDACELRSSGTYTQDISCRPIAIYKQILRQIK